VTWRVDAGRDRQQWARPFLPGPAGERAGRILRRHARAQGVTQQRTVRRVGGGVPVPAVDSMGLSTLLRIHRSACRDGIALHLDDIGPALRRLLEPTGTHAYLTTPHDSGADATGAGRAAADRPGGPRPAGV
jgi:hypothetical protein